MRELVKQEDISQTKLIVEIERLVNENKEKMKTDCAIVTTIGLVVHSFSDGFALGASFFHTELIKALKAKNPNDLSLKSENENLGWLIFIAIILHKVPATIGLSTFLRHKKMPFKNLVHHLLAFTSASPIACLLTFWYLSLTGQAKNLKETVAILLLFSAGTFLYVATIHILPEVYGKEEA